MKEIAKQEAAKDGGAPRVVNPETLFYTLKQLGETLGLQNEKFMQLTPNPPLKGIVARQKHEIGSKIMREILEEELNDLSQLQSSIKGIEQYFKIRSKL